MRIAFVIIISIFWIVSAGADTLTCTHPQVCNLISSVLKSHNVYEQHGIQEAVSISGDPHHYDPPASVLKKMLKTKFLILPPQALQPWTRFLDGKRKDHNTYTLSATKGAHFWLAPESACQAKIELQQTFGKWGLIGKTEAGPCSEESLKERLKSLVPKIKDTPLVVNHDSLTSLFHTYDISHLALRTSHHHGSVGAKSLKALDDLLKKNKSVIWIKEEHVHISKSIFKRIRKNDKIISLDTYGKFPEEISPLEKLISSLEKLN